MPVIVVLLLNCEGTTAVVPSVNMHCYFTTTVNESSTRLIFFFFGGSETKSTRLIISDYILQKPIQSQTRPPYMLTFDIGFTLQTQ